MSAQSDGTECGLGALGWTMRTTWVQGDRGNSYSWVDAVRLAERPCKPGFLLGRLKPQPVSTFGTVIASGFGFVRARRLRCLVTAQPFAHSESRAPVARAPAPFERSIRS